MMDKIQENELYISLFFSLGALFVFTISLLIYFPGQFAPDSIAMLAPIRFGQTWFSDTYSHFFIMFMDLMYSFYSEYWFLVFIQYLFLAIGIGSVFKEFYKRELISLKTGFILTIVIALFPPIFLFATAFLRDVLFAALVLLLTTWTLYYHRKNWNISLWGYLFLFILLLSIPLIRINGMVISFFIFLLLVGVSRYKKNKKIFFSSIVVFLTVLICFFGVKPQIYKHFKVAKIATKYKAIHAIHLLGAMVSNNVNLSDEDKKTLEELMPLEEWKNKYNKLTVGSLFHNNEYLHKYPMNKEYMKFNKLALKLATQNPSVLIKNRIDVTHMIWSVNGGKIEITPLKIAQLGGRVAPIIPTREYIVPKDYVDKINQWVRQNVSGNPILGRNALLMYISMICTLFLIYFKRDFISVMIILPGIANNASMFLLTLSQPYRYYLPMVFASLFIIIYTLIVIQDLIIKRRKENV
jgi:hypothetical protein